MSNQAAHNQTRFSPRVLATSYFPGKAPLEARILVMRPLMATNLGGDQTLLYGK